jgi:hypothetical protein
VLLNDPTYVEAARVLGTRLATQSISDEDRVVLAYQQVLQRTPLPDEIAVVLSVVAKERERLKRHPDAVEEVLGNGIAPVLEGADRTEGAAWTAVARVLLNLHETITRF